MRPVLSLSAVLAALATGVYAGETTNVINNGNNTASISQSGDPANAQVDIERSPGRTKMYQKNGGNSALIIQNSNPGAARNPDQDVTNMIREKASPQGRQNLDNLLRSMGLAGSK